MEVRSKTIGHFGLRSDLEQKAGPACFQGTRRFAAAPLSLVDASRLSPLAPALLHVSSPQVGGPVTRFVLEHFWSFIGRRINKRQQQHWSCLHPVRGLEADQRRCALMGWLSPVRIR